MVKKASYEIHAQDPDGEWVFVCTEESLEMALHGAITAQKNRANGYQTYRVVVYV